MPDRSADDYAAIRARIVVFEAERANRCPVTPDRALDACLRSSAPCGAHCPLRDRWTGPEAGLC